MKNASSQSAPQVWWALEPDAVASTWHVDPTSGLDDNEASRRLAEYGPNQLQATPRQSVAGILWNQVRSLIFVLLLAAAVGSAVFAQWLESLAILAVIVVNTLIGFLMEWRSVRSMEALRKLNATLVTVRRNGRAQRVPAEQLVPGDMVELEAGDSLAADLRIFRGSKLQANEAALTGESIPSSKRVEPLDATTPLAERANMLWSGTFVTRGSGNGVVVATGMRTELGKIARLVGAAAHDDRTPLEERLDAFGRALVWITLALTVLVVLTGIASGKDWFLMVETGVALAISAIPEGLPIVATLALARGMLRLARERVLIRRLAAVETLGATSVICTDKTGTLTENRLTAVRVELADGSVELAAHRVVRWLPCDRREDSWPATRWTPLWREALEIAVLCNNATVDSLHEPAEAGGSVAGTGDPLELALLAVGAAAGLQRADLLKHQPELREVAFDPELKMMATLHRCGDSYRTAVKGAPERVLAASAAMQTVAGVQPLTAEHRQAWLDRNHALASQGLRVLGLAQRRSSTESEATYENLVFLGLVALEDPPRSDVLAAIRSCRQAGIRLVMITGDQPVTASKIAAEIGLTEPTDELAVNGAELARRLRGTPAERDWLRTVPVFARVDPQDKLDLIALHQEAGAIVAMTGDGVNDAPAIEQADIGVAMGLRGTEVARAAADMVLQDDSLASLVTAIREGRIIYANIQKFVAYLLGCNTAEVLVIGISAVLNVPLPILPIQILLLNLVTDVFPALALGAGRGERDLMQKLPRAATEPILDSLAWLQIFGFAVVMTGAVLAAATLSRQILVLSAEETVTVSFLTLAFTQLWHVLNLRSSTSHRFVNEITRNPFVWLAWAVCTSILIVVVLTPGLAPILRLANPGWAGWTVAVILGMAPWLVGLTPLPFRSAEGGHA